MQRSTYLRGSSAIYVMFSLVDEHSKLSLVIASILYFACFTGPLADASFLTEMDFWGGDLEREELLLVCLVTFCTFCLVTLFLARVCFIFNLKFVRLEHPNITYDLKPYPIQRINIMSGLFKVIQMIICSVGHMCSSLISIITEG